MSNIILAETAGFCFGVNRAVEMVYDLLNKGEKVCTLGPIIHNPQLVEELNSKGVRIVESPEEVLQDEVLVIRSHGVPRAVFDQAETLGAKIADATCPFVSKIHKIVAEAGENGRTVLIAGDRDHKEVVGIIGHSKGKCFVFADETELESFVINGEIESNEPISVVSQTTFNNDMWNNCQKTLKKVYTNTKIFDTICNATAKRQQESKLLSQQCDAMIVIGGRHSSNTKKLSEVCSVNCLNTHLIETADELKCEWFSDASSIGVVAGASTPAGIIKEVLKTMSDALTPEKEEQKVNYDEMTFEEALEASLSSLNTDQKVKGYVLAVGPTELQVDIGRKQAGFVAQSEFSSDPNVKLTDAVKVGDILDLVIMKTNDQEGTVMLSKRRFDAIAGWDKVVAASESGEALEGTVSEIIKGGLTVYYTGVRIFIPASQATASRSDNIEDLKGKTVNFKVIKIERGRRAIGSIRAVLSQLRKESENKLWETIAVGDKFNGTVKSLTGYGAFVDLGGVDGMVHISELSWQRIKNPSEIVSVGDKIEVYVKSLDAEKRKISLGYKKADENPWEVFKNTYSAGSVVNVKVVSMTAYGAFARIIPGVDGLIHISQIADRRIDKPQDELSIGQEVNVQITEIDLDKKRVSLSIRALLDTQTSEETAEETKEETAEVKAEATTEENSAE
ncbi:MAG: bifunctional 4-hydroxy-3-methylbut-2-enyl diphosphate reductase/30S ribosomal protein S1 [Oscillospiraceae bacterium]|nr:bifunctional 4-hydroxy-3-methylbut-2-enyl diphosphate reductase/30S ribosomal protein S1 [Oscillospiraceae bacterium]